MNSISILNDILIRIYLEIILFIKPLTILEVISVFEID
jgi:hypothetical protein